MPTFTAAGAFRKALAAAAVSAINDTAVQVVQGFPWPQTSQDIVAVGRVTSAQETATLGPSRSRDETLTCEVLVSVFRPGGQEQEQVAADRAYTLLGLVERQVRITDTTLGGVVRLCVMTGHEMDSAPFADDTTEGRTVEVLATFMARARVKD